jgi:Transposase DDE domain
MKRLVRWTAPLIAALAVVLRGRMQTALSSRFRCEGYAAFGVDGSRLELPRTVSNEAAFSPASSRSRQQTRRSSKPSRQSAASRRKKSGRPQAWITTMWHAGSGLPWDWRIGPSDSSERGHLLAMLDGLPEDALVTADAGFAGFVGYDYWAAVLASGRDFVIRVGSNVKLLKKLGYAQSSQSSQSTARAVWLWPDKAAKKHQPPLVLRLVVVHDGKRPWYLVT